MKKRFNYLTEEEQKMPIDMALLQLTLGLQSCKTKGDVVELLQDAVNLGKKEVEEGIKQKFKRIREDDKYAISECHKELNEQSEKISRLKEQVEIYRNEALYRTRRRNEMRILRDKRRKERG